MTKLTKEQIRNDWEKRRHYALRYQMGGSIWKEYAAMGQSVASLSVLARQQWNRFTEWCDLHGIDTHGNPVE